MSWIQRAKPGDKVVCIAGFDDFETVSMYGGPAIQPQDVPAKGQVCTISKIELSPLSGLIFVFTEEFPKCGFEWSAFRPVEPRKTDISFAHEILRKASKPVKECV